MSYVNMGEYEAIKNISDHFDCSSDTDMIAFIHESEDLQSNYSLGYITADEFSAKHKELMTKYNIL